MRADLHLHSLCSDGTDSVEFIIDKAKVLGLGMIAITDHDTIEGVDRAVEYGKSKGVRVIPGIELSSYSTTEIHILGYNIEYRSSVLTSRLKELQDLRTERVLKIFDKLDGLGIKLNRNEIKVDGSVGRPHIANLMKESGYVSCVPEAFDKYLATGKAAYVPSNRITPKDAVKLIKESGGLAVLAHPLRLLNSGDLNNLIQGLLPYGLDGMECFYPTHSQADEYTFLDIAKKYSLLVTGGSDYHGDNKYVVMDEAKFVINKPLLEALNNKSPNR